MGVWGLLSKVVFVKKNNCYRPKELRDIRSFDNVPSYEVFYAFLEKLNNSEHFTRLKISLSFRPMYLMSNPPHLMIKMTPLYQNLHQSHPLSPHCLLSIRIVGYICFLLLVVGMQRILMPRHYLVIKSSPKSLFATYFEIKTSADHQNTVRQKSKLIMFFNPSIH